MFANFLGGVGCRRWMEGQVLKCNIYSLVPARVGVQDLTLKSQIHFRSGLSPPRIPISGRASCHASGDGVPRELDDGGTEI